MKPIAGNACVILKFDKRIANPLIQVYQHIALSNENPNASTMKLVCTDRVRPMFCRKTHFALKLPDFCFTVLDSVSSRNFAQCLSLIIPPPRHSASSL
mmetsp:Transcript_33542/g.56129  ORF Transcript_33542/g.56129 Transcript_33542/m.56129 type:complete len:98 (-) Transcript_33542:403-696(-)